MTCDSGLHRSKAGSTRVQSHVEISVTDTGEGTDANFLPELFHRFTQADGSASRKYGGLGLGLSIVKNHVEMHSGTVRATSLWRLHKMVVESGIRRSATVILLPPVQGSKKAV
jgi:signal transduction histidine kinase